MSAIAGAPDNLDRFVAALQPFGLLLRGMPAGVANVFDRRAGVRHELHVLVLADGEEFDVLAEMSAIGGYDARLSTAPSPWTWRATRLKCWRWKT